MTKDEMLLLSQEEFVQMVWPIAVKVVYHVCRSMRFRDWEDNVTEAVQELWNKRERFDPNLTTWNTYVHNVVKWRCMHSCRDKNANPGYLQEFWLKVTRLEQRLGPLTDAEIARHMDCPIEVVTRRRVLDRSTYYLEELRDGHREIPSDMCTEDEALHRMALSTLEGGIDQLTPKQQQIVRLMIESGFSATETAAALGVSINNISHHMKRICKRLRWVLRGQRELLVGAFDGR